MKRKKQLWDVNVLNEMADIMIESNDQQTKIVGEELSRALVNNEYSYIDLLFSRNNEIFDVAAEIYKARNIPSVQSY